MMNANWLLTLLLILVLAIGGGWYLSNRDDATPAPVPTPGTSTPSAAQISYDRADANMIRITSPRPGASASSSFAVVGEARGNWYFEASFPLEVLSATGTRLVQIPIQAQGEWMTENFVPFSATATIPSWYRGPATVVFHNDNASGLPENDRSARVPITIR